MLKITLPMLTASLLVCASFSAANENIRSDDGEQWSLLSTGAISEQPIAIDNQLIVQVSQSPSVQTFSRQLLATSALPQANEFEQFIAANNALIIDRSTLEKKPTAMSLRSFSASTVTPSVVEYLVEVDSQQRQTLIASLNAQPSVQWVEPNYLYYTNESPNDPYYTQQKLWGLTKVNMATAWDLSKGAGSVVAVIDTGVDRTHEDLASNIWQNVHEIPFNQIDDDNNGFIDDTAGWDFANKDNNPDDVHSHGTHVAGTVAAISNNQLGIVGVAPQAKILPLKALGDTGSGSAFDIAKAIRYAADSGADVINMSLGGQGTSYTLASAIDYAVQRNVVVVVAAGNDNINSQYQYPANANGVISVGALQNYNGLDKSYFSNYGPDVDIFAPGSNIYSLAPNNGYSSKSGTSMAAPHIAGLAALIRSVQPGLSPASVRARMIANSVDLTTSGGSPGWDEIFGFGMMNPVASLTDASIAADGYPEFTSPLLDKTASDNVLVNGLVTFKGSTNTKNLAYYEIAFASAQQSPRQFSTAFTGYQAVTDDVLMQWDTATVGDGRYFVRLRCVNTNGDYVDTFHQVDVDHDLKAGWPVLNSYWLGHPAGRTDGKLVARAPALIDLDNDGDLEILVVDNNRHNHRAIRAWQHNGTRYGDYTFIYPGVEEIITPITIADINADNQDDIIFGARLVSNTQRNAIYAYNKQGELLPGFPTGWVGETFNNEAVVNSFDDRIIAVDITGDGQNEIVVQSINWNNTRQAEYRWQLNAIRGDGSAVPGFPVQHYFSDLLTLYGHSDETFPITVADWFSDGSTDIVVIWPDDNAGVSLRVYNAQGAQIATIALGAAKISDVKNPLVIDLDADGQDELLVQVGNNLHAYTMQGQLKAGWPTALPTETSRYTDDAGRFMDSLIATDIDNNGSPDLLLNGAAEAVTLNNKGALLLPHITLDRISSRGYPVRTLLDAQANQQALIFGSGNHDNKLNAVYLTGESVAGWPKRMSPISGGVAIGDIDNDGELDVVAHSQEGFIYAWKWGAPAANDNLAWQYDHGDKNQTRARITAQPNSSCQPSFNSMLLRGSFNAWATQAMAFNPIQCNWQGNITLSNSQTIKFKFDVFGDWATNFGDQNADGIADSGGDDISKTLAAGSYQVSFDDISKQYSVMPILTGPINDKASVTFTCHNGYTTMGESVYVVGNHATLGNWAVTAAAQRLNPSQYPSWQVTLATLPANTDIDWKCVVANEATLAIKQWQNGGNNFVRTGTVGSTVNATGYLQ